MFDKIGSDADVSVCDIMYVLLVVIAACRVQYDKHFPCVSFLQFITAKYDKQGRYSEAYLGLLQHPRWCAL